jgi:DNA primase
MSTAVYKVDFAEIKRSVSMEAVMQFLSVTGLKPRGSHQWKGACPFCKGQDCFVVSNDGGRDKTGAFNCFKCPAGGDQIEMVSLARGNSRRDAQGSLAAAKELHDRFIAKGDAPDQAGAAGDSSSHRSPLPLRERRQGFDPDAYAKSLDPAHAALAGLGIEPETLREWKAGYSASGVNRGRLALPVAALDGTIAGYMGRALKEESPTLIFPNGAPLTGHIFGADRVVAGQLFLVRDPLDVLKAFESGCGNTVCFLTEQIAGIQLESLAALMDERKCDSLSFF